MEKWIGGKMGLLPISFLIYGLYIYYIQFFPFLRDTSSSYGKLR